MLKALVRFATSLLSVAAVSALSLFRAKVLEIDASAGGQTFHGLGAISGGGATSRLLVDYPEPQKSQILDYLFKPNYGASFHMLKVEIGGDSQSTDGTEPSHMHSADDLDYRRGYEWWLLQEAKKRNPQIKTYALPWAYPGWVGGPEQSSSPFKYPELTSKYILKWLEGARNVYGIEIDYVGIWNERDSNGRYVKLLRKTLNEAGFVNTTLVAKDGVDGICLEMAKDPGYAEAVGVVGLHYPSDYRDRGFCHKLGFGVEGGKPLWASEESSSYNDLNGAACWARVVTSHWVLQNMTSSIMWNLVGSYFHGTAWFATSMLTADEPWTGNYHEMEVVWATAHITQFTQIGWKLLNVGSGSGELPAGGFYATYVDPKSDDWTLTVVKIDEDHASCTRPKLPEFNTSAETVTFRLSPTMRNAKELAVWYSNFVEFNEDGSVKNLFRRLKNIVPTDGMIKLDVPVGAFFTISTILEGPTKGTPPTPIPKSDPTVPLPFSDDFEAYPVSHEGKWWSDQIGSFEVHFSQRNDGSATKVMRQMVPQLPIGWSDHGTNGPVTLLGMREWQDVTVKALIRLPPDTRAGAAGCLGTRLDQMWDDGVVICVSAAGNYTLSVGGPRLGGSVNGRRIKVGNVSSPLHGFFELSLRTVKDKADATLNGERLFTDVHIRDVDTGFVGLGASDWIKVEFDDVEIQRAGPRWDSEHLPKCKGAQTNTALRARACATNGLSSEDQSFDLLADWGIRHRSSGLCVSALSEEAAARPKAGAPLNLQRCDPKDARQQFRNHYPTVRHRPESFLLTADDDRVLNLVGGLDGTVAVDLEDSRRKQWNKWSYFPNTRQLRNQYVADVQLGYPMCLSACDEESERPIQPKVLL